MPVFTRKEKSQHKVFHLRENKEVNARPTAVDKNQEVIDYYRKRACLKDDEPVTEDNLNRKALDETSGKYAYDRLELKKLLLNKKDECVLKEADGQTTLDDVVSGKEKLNVTIQQDVLADKLKEEAEKMYQKVLNRLQEEKRERSLMEVYLDDALRKSKAARRNYYRSGTRGGWQNVIFVGQAGTGKTATVRDWARENGVDLIAVKANELSNLDLAGAPVVDKEGTHLDKLPSTELRGLAEAPNPVLFLDEYTTAEMRVRMSLLTLIQDHVLTNATVLGHEVFLENFLFTIIACNPGNYGGNKALTAAEKTRGKVLTVPMEVAPWLRAMGKKYISDGTKALEEYKSKGDEDDLIDAQNFFREFILMATIGLDPIFLSGGGFTTPEEEDNELDDEDPTSKALVFRSLTDAINDSDGFKQRFLDECPGWFTSTKVDLLKSILQDYQDVDDKANAALKAAPEAEEEDDDEEEDVFTNSSAKNLRKRLADYRARALGSDPNNPNP